MRNNIILLILIYSTSLSYGEDDSQLKAIGEAWYSGRHNFKELRCTYKIYSGAADSVDSVLEKKFNKPLTAHCLWVIKDNNERMSLSLPEGVKNLPDDSENSTIKVIKQEKGSSISIHHGFRPQEYISNGKFFASGGTNIFSIYSPEHPKSYRNFVTNPLSMGMMGQGEESSPKVIFDNMNLIKKQDNKIRYTIDKSSNYQLGTEIVDIITVNMTSGESFQKYIFCPTRSMMLVDFIVGTGQTITFDSRVNKVVNTKYGWFPVESHRLRGEPPIVEYLSWIVDDLRTDNVDDSDFKLLIPAESYVSDILSNEQLITKEPYFLTPSNIEQLRDKVASKKIIPNLKSNPPVMGGSPDPTIPHDR